MARAEPAGQDPVSAIVSGSYGGNLVLRDLGVGSHLSGLRPGGVAPCGGGKRTG